MTDALEAGKNDESLRGDLDPGRAAASLMFIITGFFNQLSLSGESYTAHLSQGIRDFCFYSFRFILESLKSAADI
jgi:hypothetical protein